jgi:hypothetical protein
MACRLILNVKTPGKSENLQNLLKVTKVELERTWSANNSGILCTILATITKKPMHFKR